MVELLYATGLRVSELVMADSRRQILMSGIRVKGKGASSVSCRWARGRDSCCSICGRGAATALKERASGMCRFERAA